VVFGPSLKPGVSTVAKAVHAALVEEGFLTAESCHPLESLPPKSLVWIRQLPAQDPVFTGHAALIMDGLEFVRTLHRGGHAELRTKVDSWRWVPGSVAVVPHRWRHKRLGSLPWLCVCLLACLHVSFLFLGWVVWCVAPGDTCP